jgi:hypothetical protein
MRANDNLKREMDGLKRNLKQQAQKAREEISTQAKAPREIRVVKRTNIVAVGNVGQDGAVQGVSVHQHAPIRQGKDIGDETPDVS